MKLGQKLCPNEISAEFETGVCRVKNKATRSKKKKLVNTVEVTFHAESSCNFVEMFVLMISWLSVKVVLIR